MKKSKIRRHLIANRKRRQGFPDPAGVHLFIGDDGTLTVIPCLFRSGTGGCGKAGHHTTGPKAEDFSLSQRLRSPATRLGAIDFRLLTPTAAASRSHSARASAPASVAVGRRDILNPYILVSAASHVAGGIGMPLRQHRHHRLRHIDKGHTMRSAMCMQAASLAAG